MELAAVFADKPSEPVCISAAVILSEMAQPAVANLQLASAEGAAGVLFTLNEKYLLLY